MYFLKEAEKIKEHLSQRSQPWVLLMKGNLGAGKTTFTKTFLSLFGIPPQDVQSPTFLKLLTYEIPPLFGGGSVLHMDTYRMEKVEEIVKLELEHYADTRIWIIEWPELFMQYRNDYAYECNFLNQASFCHISLEAQ